MADKSTEANEIEMFFSIAQEEADKRGISVEALMDWAHNAHEIYTSVIPKDGRLEYVESLVKQGVIGPTQADMAIRKNHVLEDEIRNIAVHSASLLEKELGIAVPNFYMLRFDETLNPDCHAVAGGFTDWHGRLIILPSEGCIQIPIIVSHEQAHAYQAENSNLFNELKQIWNKGHVKKYDSVRDAGYFIIEGFAVFVSSLYAKLRDNAVGKDMYSNQLTEINGFRYLLDIANKTDHSMYYAGFEHFKKIYAHHGIDGVKHAANTFMTNEELIKFSSN